MAGLCPLPPSAVPFGGFDCWKLPLKNVCDSKQPFLGSAERISAKRNHFSFFSKRLCRAAALGRVRSQTWLWLNNETHCPHQGKTPCPFCLTQSLAFQLCCQQKGTWKRVEKEINQQLLLPYGRAVRGDEGSSLLANLGLSCRPQKLLFASI